ncbi:hypothetical protein CEXT_715771 [Caerostris extrusa]|uniref:Uncharacterized protein n=1 Tax=Caerostris extrusa TaxID=172846 RepID=A0AAV4N5Q5_CAEEX|nr:hypothetical protein CEXT_715771 [Caerostris extrusa]
MKSPSPIIAHESAPASQCSRDIETTALFDSAGWLMNGVLMAPQTIRLCNVRAMGYSDRTLFISQEERNGANIKFTFRRLCFVSFTASNAC